MPRTSTPPRFARVAEGDYETADGRYRLYRLCDVYPPAWNVEDVHQDDWESGDYDPAVNGLIVDGAATMRDAVALFEAHYRRSSS